jgi:PhnB protein
MANTRPIPQGFHTMTPNLVIRDCAKAIEFYKRALGAQQIMRMPAPDGKSIWHAELKIGDSIFFMNDEMPGMTQSAPSADRPSPVTLWIYTQDCDASYQRAIDAGATSKMKPDDAFWGDRIAAVVDPFGYQWSFATHVKDMTEEEMRRAGEEFARTMGAGH